MTEQVKTAPSSMEALVIQAAEGDRAAMEELYKRTNAELWRTVRALTSSEADAMDLMQETYLKAFSELKSLRNRDSFLPWLKKIAVNEHRQELRRNQPLLFSELSVENEDALTPEPLRPPTPERVYERKEQAEAVQQALSTLPDGQRTVLVLYYCEQYSVEEIAEQLGITKSTVKVQLHRGRKALAAALRRGGLLLSGLMLSKYLLRWQSAQAAPLNTAGKPLPAQPQKYMPLPVKTAGRVLLERAALGAVSALTVAGLAFGTVALTRELRAERQTMPEPPIQIRAQETEPSVPRETRLTRAPGETAVATEEPEITDPKTVPKEQPATLPVTTPAQTQPQPGEPKGEEPKPSEPKREEPKPSETKGEEPEPSESGQTEPPVVATPPDAPEPTGELTPEETVGRLPTENPYPFSYQEVTVTEGQTWVGSFASEEPWEIVEKGKTPDVPGEYVYAYSDSRMFAGMQIISIKTGGHGTVRFSLRKRDGSTEVPWLTIHILPKEE